MEMMVHVCVGKSTNSTSIYLFFRKCQIPTSPSIHIRICHFVTLSDDGRCGNAFSCKATLSACSPFHLQKRTRNVSVNCLAFYFELTNVDNWPERLGFCSTVTLEPIGCLIGEVCQYGIAVYIMRVPCFSLSFLFQKMPKNILHSKISKETKKVEIFKYSYLPQERKRFFVKQICNFALG